ncbi:MAG: hypothetical protein KDI59_10980 [Xanthomonadales bacterium]|nr:hypothetical protein [Xanthomonadales bacterium]MCB1605164.1 hypothetical protein [Xanthomonadales bacterium]
MKKEEVEIYSDASNIAVMRHPGREFPGSLIQGDSLYSLLQNIKEAKQEIDNGDSGEASEILNDVIENLTFRLEHYKKVLKEHGRDLPFVE